MEFRTIYKTLINTCRMCYVCYRPPFILRRFNRKYNYHILWNDTPLKIALNFDYEYHLESKTSVNQQVEKRREFNVETHIAFIDYEKAFDRVDRGKLWYILKENGYPLHFIQVFQSWYNWTEISYWRTKINLRSNYHKSESETRLLLITHSI